MEVIFLYNQYLASIWHENYAWIFVCRQYLFQEENISLRAKLEENHELQGLSVYILKVKCRPLCLLGVVL